MTVYLYAKHDIRFDSANNKFYFMFREQRFNTLQGKPFTLPLWAVRTILHLIDWKCMQYKSDSRLYEITHPNGSRVNISLSTARWLVAHAIHDDALQAQQEIAGMFLDKP